MLNPGVTQENDLLSNMSDSEQISFLKSILQGSRNYSILVGSFSGTILTWNTGSTYLYGYEANEIIGKHFTVLFNMNKTTPQQVKEIIDTAMKTGNWSGKTSRLRKDGSTFTAYSIITLRYDSKNKPCGFTAMSIDITDLDTKQNELEQAYQQLTASNASLQEALIQTQNANQSRLNFIENMSHELRSPLNAIIGFTQLMHSGKVGAISTQHKDYMEEVLTSAHRLLSFIDQVLDFGNIEIRNMIFNPEPTNLGQLINEVMLDFNALIVKKKSTLFCERRLNCKLCQYRPDSL